MSFIPLPVTGTKRSLVAKFCLRRRQSFMPKTSRRDAGKAKAPPAARAPFLPGSMVVVTLGNPRDKFWGMILSLAVEGLSAIGIELASFEDLVVMVKNDEPFTATVVFFPMHRIERIELDLPDGSLLSLSQRFSAKTGLDPVTMLASSRANSMNDQNAGAETSAALPKKEPA